jgi:hypothetical protein
MAVSLGCWSSSLSENDHASWASIDTQCTARAHVVVDNENHIVVWVIARQFGVVCLGNSIGSDHVDALPWANIDTALAHDAFTLIDVNELFWLYSLAQIIGVNFNQLVFS